jgi:hypothetical protein
MVAITPGTLAGLTQLGQRPADLVARVRRATAKVAESDPNIFIPFVIRDEETGLPIVQAPMHQEWQAEASAHDRLVLLAHIESGKTQQLSIGRTLYELGRNRSLRIVVVSSTNDLATKIARSIQQYITGSAELHTVFPDLLPSVPWTPVAFNVQRPGNLKDYSVQVSSVGGHILGSRFDLIILDDVLDWENSRTQYQREKVIDWVFSSLLGRLTPRGRVIAIGNPWHPEDLLHLLAKRGYRALKYPVLDEQGNTRWAKRWPLERITAWQTEFGPLEFARQLLCVARSDGESRFKREWLNDCMKRAREAGVFGFVDRWEPRPGWYTVTGVDLGASQRAGSALTVLFTLLIGPDESRQILEIQSGKWTSPDIVEKLHDTHRRYHSTIFVESNAAQAYIVQFSQSRSSIPVRPFLTGKNKLNPALGVESLAAEMAAKKWLIPNSPGGQLHPEVAGWIDDMLYYTPEAHTGDRLMASWIAREGAKKGQRKVQVGHLDLMRR